MSTQHAFLPLSLPRDDNASKSLPTSSPTRSLTHPRDDAKPIAHNRPKGSPPPPHNSQTVTTSHSSRPSSPQPPKQPTLKDDEDVLDNEDELDDKGESDDEDELDDEDEESSEIVDMDVFSQLIELDEDDPDFSKEMAEQYFSQAIATFGKLDEALLDKDLKELSSLGHFLKGSSAALGLSKVQKSCEKIQNYGNLRDEDADRSLVEHEALKLITKTLARVKKEYIEAEKWLKNYHNTA